MVDNVLYPPIDEGWGNNLFVVVQSKSGECVWKAKIADMAKFQRLTLIFNSGVCCLNSVENLNASDAQSTNLPPKFRGYLICLS